MEADNIHWFHSINLGNYITKGRIPYQCQMWNCMIFPEFMTGKSCLDVGAWDGFYSFECEKRGAKRVLAIDNLNHWIKENDKEIVVKTEGFELARQILSSKVEFKEMDALDVDKLTETFDYIIAYGLVYHLEAPYLFIKKAYDRLNNDGELLIEAHTINEQRDRPMAYFYGNRELCNDPSVWWGMTAECICKMCLRAGFKEAKEHFFDGFSRSLIKAIK